MPCNCPETYTSQGWEPVCEARDDTGRFITARHAEDQGSEPTSWRCPRCQRGIVRTFMERTEAGEPSRFVDHVEDEPAVRAGYRCRVATCGWYDWVMWLPRS
jgi:hypothetical protein